MLRRWCYAFHCVNILSKYYGEVCKGGLKHMYNKILLPALLSFSLLLSLCGSAAASSTSFDGSISFDIGMPSGGFSIEEKDVSREEITEEDADDINRAMRSFRGIGSDTLITNEATSFYYYSQLGEDEQEFYDAMYKAAQDPVTGYNFQVVHTTLDPNSDECTYKFLLSYYALLFDHPELFWLYYNNGRDYDFLVSICASAGVGYDFYFVLNDTYDEYREEMTAFHEAAEELLDSVDLNASEADIAHEIHDKLCDLVTYDIDAAASEDGDLAHTAYGALVANSAGTENYAVCDGYSLAYEYLLQQAGINCTVMLGGIIDTEGIGGHAWNIVELDGTWYEVDSTWDDPENFDGFREYTDVYPFIEEALQDEAYMDLVSHHRFCISTAKMDDFIVTDDYFYTSSDGSFFSFLNDSQRMRYSELDTASVYGQLTQLAPVAESSLSE